MSSVWGGCAEQVVTRRCHRPLYVCQRAARNAHRWGNRRGAKLLQQTEANIRNALCVCLLQCAVLSTCACATLHATLPRFHTPRKHGTRSRTVGTTPRYTREVHVPFVLKKITEALPEPTTDAAEMGVPQERKWDDFSQHDKVLKEMQVRLPIPNRLCCVDCAWVSHLFPRSVMGRCRWWASDSLQLLALIWSARNSGWVVQHETPCLGGNIVSCCVLLPCCDTRNDAMCGEGLYRFCLRFGKRRPASWKRSARGLFVSSVERHFRTPGYVVVCVSLTSAGNERIVDIFLLIAQEREEKEAREKAAQQAAQVIRVRALGGV